MQPIKGNMTGNQLRWIVHVQRVSQEAPMKIIDHMDFNCMNKG